MAPWLSTGWVWKADLPCLKSALSRLLVNGREISIFNTPAKFQAADIIANYYMSVNAPCQAFPGHDSDRNDTYLDQYEWGGTHSSGAGCGAMQSDVAQH